MQLQMRKMLGGESLQLGVVTLGGVALEQVNGVLMARDLIVLVLLGELVALETLQLVQLALVRAV